MAKCIRQTVSNVKRVQNILKESFINPLFYKDTSKTHKKKRINIIVLPVNSKHNPVKTLKLCENLKTLQKLTIEQIKLIYESLNGSRRIRNFIKYKTVITCKNFLKIPKDEVLLLLLNILTLILNGRSLLFLNLFTVSI